MIRCMRTVCASARVCVHTTREGGEMTSYRTIFTSLILSLSLSLSLSFPPPLLLCPPSITHTHSLRIAYTALYGSSPSLVNLTLELKFMPPVNFFLKLMFGGSLFKRSLDDGRKGGGRSGGRKIGRVKDERYDCNALETTWFLPRTHAHTHTHTQRRAWSTSTTNK